MAAQRAAGQRSPACRAQRAGAGETGAGNITVTMPPMALAIEKLWYYWLAWALVIGTVLTLVALVVGYIVKVESPRFIRSDQLRSATAVSQLGRLGAGGTHRHPASHGATIPSRTRITTRRLQPDFAELTAAGRVSSRSATGLRSFAGPARARVTDRSGWVQANIASFQRLLRPVTDSARESGCPEERRTAVRVEGRRRRGRHVARMDVGPSARAVRPSGGRRQRR